MLAGLANALRKTPATSSNHVNTRASGGLSIGRNFQGLPSGLSPMPTVADVSPAVEPEAGARVSRQRERQTPKLQGPRLVSCVG